jgi:hypothetical protein
MRVFTAGLELEQATITGWFLLFACLWPFLGDHPSQVGAAMIAYSLATSFVMFRGGWRRRAASQTDSRARLWHYRLLVAAVGFVLVAASFVRLLGM